MPSSRNNSFPLRNRLDELPNEILEMVMRFSCGVTALHALVCANGQAEVLFARIPHALMISAIQNSGMELQLQKLYCTIISVRERYIHGTASEKPRAYVDARLKDRSTTIDLDISFTPSSKSIDILEDAAQIHSSIAQAEASIIKLQLGKPTRRTVLIRDREPSAAEFEKQQQSRTELHRVRRALWRLRLFFEAYYEPYISLAAKEQAQKEYPHLSAAENHTEPTQGLRLWHVFGEAKDDYIESLSPFVDQMTGWEIE